MASILDENICPPSFLSDDTRKFSIIVIPWSIGLLCEPLNTSESGVLDDDLALRKLTRGKRGI